MNNQELGYYTTNSCGETIYLGTGAATAQAWRNALFPGKTIFSGPIKKDKVDDNFVKKTNQHF